MGAPPDKTGSVRPSEGTKLLGAAPAAAEAPVTWVQVVKHNSAIIFAVVFLMACQSGMLLVNKAVMVVWDLPITVTLLQMAFSVFFILTLNLVYPTTLRVGSWVDARRWALWVPWLFAAMLATSMLALHFSSTGAVVVTRNIAPIVTLAIEAALKEKVAVDVWTVGALVYTLVGVALYMLNDVQFSGIGFVCILANLAAGVLERVVQRRLLAVEPVDLSKMVCVIINNAVALLPVALLLWPTHEPRDWHSLGADDPQGPEHPASAYTLLVLSCFVGVAIGWAGVNAQVYLTATSFMVVGNVNKFIVIGVGMIWMNESKSWEAILGCFIAISGGFLYALARTRLQEKLKRQKDAEKLAQGEAVKP